MKDKQEVTIKGLKTFMGMDQCSVYLRGKRAFCYSEDRNSGEGSVDIINRHAHKEIEEWCSNQPPRESEWSSNGIEYCIVFLISELVDDLKVERKFKRLCRTKTLIRLPGDKKETYRPINRRFTSEVHAAILEKYPGVEIINLQFAK